MKLSMSKSRENVWVWLFWGFGIYFLLELGPFVIAARVLNRSARELVGPYLAFAVPWAIFAPLIWWLRKWEEQGTTPKRLAHGWAVGMVFFGVAAAIAVFYSGNALRLMDPTHAIGDFIAVVLFMVPILYFTMHRLALTRICARATGKQGSASPK